MMKESQTGNGGEKPGWPDSTFVMEEEEETHYMGSHWDPFFEDSSDFFIRIPEMLSGALLLTENTKYNLVEHQEPASWKFGCHMAWPVRTKGVIFTLHIGEEHNFLESVYPFYSTGKQLALELMQVKVWHDGVSAQIIAAWKGVELCFFDTEFFLNRRHYQAGTEYDFILTGIAYEASPARVMEIPWNPGPEEIAWLYYGDGEHDVSPQEIPDKLSLKGAAMWFSIPEWDIDDYRFRGPARQIWEEDDILGEQGWRVRIVIVREGDEELELDILITRRSWQGSEAPAIGQDIEGTLWLQGFLWSGAGVPLGGNAGRNV